MAVLSCKTIETYFFSSAKLHHKRISRCPSPFSFLFILKYTFRKLSERKLKSLHMKKSLKKINAKGKSGFKVNTELSGLRPFQLFMKELFCIHLLDVNYSHKMSSSYMFVINVSLDQVTFVLS